MSKRFTDTVKWEDKWFRKLPNDMKLFWYYILDKCDIAGIWKFDLELVQYFFKISLTEKEILKYLNTDKKERIIISPDKEEWFIKDFVQYQYGTLSLKCKPHLAVIKILKLHSLDSYINIG